MDQVDLEKGSQLGSTKKKRVKLGQAGPQEQEFESGWMGSFSHTNFYESKGAYLVLLLVHKPDCDLILKTPQQSLHL